MPARHLGTKRAQTAKLLVEQTDLPLADIAFGVGFDSLSAFHENFRTFNGLTPAAYRELRTARTFSLTLPPGFLLPYLRRALSRDIHSVTERLVADTYTTVVRLSTGPAQLTLQLSPTRIDAVLSTGSAPEAHALVVGLLGLDEDAAAFADASPYPTPDDIQKDVYWESDNPSERKSEGRLFFN